MNWNFKTEPFAHQFKALNLAKDEPVFGYLMDQGCVDAQTEYLSPAGWRRMDNYDGGMVCQTTINGKASLYSRLTI